MFGKRVNEAENEGGNAVKVKKARKPMSKKKKRIIIITVIVLILALVIVIPKIMSGGAPALFVTTGTVEKNGYRAGS